MKLAENLKNSRISMSLSQKKLADSLQVSRGALSMWEIGKREPSIAILIKIADFFDLTLDELVGREV